VASSGERTEKATSKRRKQAEDDGQFPYSAEFTSALTLAVTLVVLFYMTSSIAGFRAFMESVLSAAVKGADSDTMISVVRDAGKRFLLFAAPLLGAAFLAALAGNIIQGAPRSGAQAGTLRWDHLNPARGFSKLKARFSWLEWLKIILLVAVTLTVLWTTLGAFWERVVTLPLRDVPSSFEFMASIARRVAGYLVGFVIVLGASRRASCRPRPRSRKTSRQWTETPRSSATSGPNSGNRRCAA
jgi:flagellar biosynthetic protein FlhB